MAVQVSGGNTVQNGRSINIRGESDAVFMRKEIAGRRARKAVEDAWSGDRQIALDVKVRKEKLQELQCEIARKTGYLMAYEEKKAELKEAYGIDDESEEQKKLLQKRELSLEDSEIVLTEAEKKRLAEIDEYQERVREMDQISFDIWVDQKTGIRDMLSDEKAGIAAITAIHLERLKFREMSNAQKTAKKLEESAGNDVIDMLAKDAKDYIDKQLEEKREEAKEKAEEEAEKEEKLEVQRLERKMKQKEFEQAFKPAQSGVEQLELEQVGNEEAEASRIEQQKDAREQEDILMEVEKSSTGTASTSSQTRIEIRQMLHKMNLLEEDLKGMEVDDSI